MQVDFLSVVGRCKGFQNCIHTKDILVANYYKLKRIVKKAI